MPRNRENRTHPFIQRIMDDRGYETIQEMSDKTKIPVRTLYNMADGSTNNRNLETHYKAAKALGYTMDRWCEHMLGISAE